jgi:uncharacterized phage protein gp47/JayE
MLIQDLVSKNLDTIRQEMFDRLAAKQEEYAANGWLPIRLNLNKGIVRGLIELWCWGLWQLYLFLVLVLKQAFADTATGLFLELHCKQVNVSRKAATKVVGVVYFTREASAGNCAIPAGRIVKTLPDGTGRVYRYVTTEAAVIPDGATEVAVPVTAEDYGTSANATAGQISQIVTVIPGVDGVENRAGWITSEGSDQELDEPLRLRYQLAWKALSGCTKYAYEAWALEVTGVVGAKILDQHPRGQGTIDVVITGSAGVPTGLLLDAVTANILGTGNADEKQPINDDVLVRGVTGVNVDYVAEFELTSGDPDQVMTIIENRIRALFLTGTAINGISPLTAGMDATNDRIKAAAMQPQVKKVNTAFADVQIDDDQLAVLHTLTLTWIWASED